MKRFTTVDEFMSAQKEWLAELNKLRAVLRSTALQETIKWGIPVYTINNKNVIGLGSFKSYVGLWFFQGTFLNDSHKVLINAQEGKTKGMRQWRFFNIDEIDTDLVIKYAQEAIQNQKEGKEIKAERKTAFEIPEVLNDLLSKNSELKSKFETFTPGKQREFTEYIGSAKREATKLSRLEKITPMIIQGIGLNDRYRK